MPKIVVTRSQPQASGFVEKLKSLGAEVLLSPTIQILPPSSYRRLDKSIQKLDSYDWLIFTSVNGVKKFMERLDGKFQGKKVSKKIKTFAIGPVTALEMRRSGFTVTKVSKEYVAESILEEMNQVSGKKILIPRAREARELLPRELGKRGAKVDCVETYRTDIDSSHFDEFRKELKKDKIDCVTFTSSSTVRNFFSLLNSEDREALKKSRKICAASIGPVTTHTLQEYDWTPQILAKKPTTKHLLQAIRTYYGL